MRFTFEQMRERHNGDLNETREKFNNWIKYAYIPTFSGFIRLSGTGNFATLFTY